MEDISWCQSRISALKKPNNPANKSLWQLINLLSRQVEDQADLIKDLSSGLVGAKERVSVLEMSSLMIHLRVSVLEEAMEIDPPVTDLSGDDDSTDSEYADVDDGGAMLVDDLEEERDQENVVPILVPPPIICLDTPRPPTITGDKAPCTEPVHAWYMVILCPEYQHFPEPEHTEFFQNILKNVFAISWFSML